PAEPREARGGIPRSASGRPDLRKEHEEEQQERERAGKVRDARVGIGDVPGERAARADEAGEHAEADEEVAVHAATIEEGPERDGERHRHPQMDEAEVARAEALV